MASGTLPDRAGQPTQIQYHMTLGQLLDLHAGQQIPAGLTSPAGPGAAATGVPGWAAGDGPGWILDRATAQGYACDAHITPIVTGHVDRVALALAVRTFIKATQSASGGGCPVGQCDPAGAQRTTRPTWPTRTTPVPCR